MPWQWMFWCALVALLGALVASAGHAKLLGIRHARERRDLRDRLALIQEFYAGTRMWDYGTLANNGRQYWIYRGASTSPGLMIARYCDMDKSIDEILEEIRVETAALKRRLSPTWP